MNRKRGVMGSRFFATRCYDWASDLKPRRCVRQTPSPADAARAAIFVLDDAMDVDGVSAVLGAIAASAGAGGVDAIKDITKDAITGTRDRLVELVRKRLQGDSVGDAKLTVYAAEPTLGNGQALHGHLVDAGIEHDAEIVALARDVLAAAGPAAMAPGSVAANVIKQINRDGGTGFIGGQHVHNYVRPQQAQRVCWELHRLSGDGYELRNTGTATATDVVVTANVTLIWTKQPESEISDGSSVMFVYGQSLADPAPVLTVSYGVGGSPERKTWRRPLPS